jgi:DNA-binding beta-propeller fold protein YncE
MNKKIYILMVIILVAQLFGPLPFARVARADPLPPYEAQGSMDVSPATPTLTAVDPMAWAISGDVMPVRPFLYSVDAVGITITRFNDNQVVGFWPWPTPEDVDPVIYTVLPDGSFTGFTPPDVWEPVAMTVSYPTETELANRVKEIPDLTPPPTYVYVVMAHSGYTWTSSVGSLRDTIVPESNPDQDSSMLIQIDVSDPSFSTSLDPANPVPPHVAAAILGHQAGQPVYDRKTGNVYIGNMPSPSLSAGLTSFVSVIQRIPPEVAEVEAEVPGISVPVIRCGPQHPESGIPMGKPQAFACYDPSGVHPIDDNEHVGAYGEIKQWDTAKTNPDGTPDLFQEQYVWEFRNLPDWLSPHTDLLSGEYDGILYGTPPLAPGEWYAEARVHNLGDEFGVFSDWTPVQLLVTPTAEYLPIKAQFAAGVPVAYPLEGMGSCDLLGAPAWVDVKTVDNGCIVMGRSPLDGEYYNFTMPGFTPAGYSAGLTFSGNVFGEYGFVPLTEGVGISGLAWHQVSKEADPSTETPVLSIEFIGVDPNTGQLWNILPPPGQPQPPNDRPPETALTLDLVSEELAADEVTPLQLTASGLGQVAVEADRDIYVAADEVVIKVSGGATTSISLPEGMLPSSLSLDSDLRTAIPGIEPGQSDHGVLWAAGAGNVVVIDTGTPTMAQSFALSEASSVSVDFSTQSAYAADGSSTLKIYGAFARPLMEPRIWSAEEFTWNLGQTAEVQLMATGDAIPTLSKIGDLPPGLVFTPNPDGTATISGTPTEAGGGGDPGGELDIEGGDYAMAITASSSQGTYAQAFGITVQSPPTITSDTAATFVAGTASSFQVTGTGWPTPIFYILDPEDLPAGIQLIDNEDGTASLVGTAENVDADTVYTFHIYATTGCPPDADQLFTLTVKPAGTVMDPVFTSVFTATWEAVGAPYSPDLIAITSIGSPTPALTIEPTLPAHVSFVDNGNSTASIGVDCIILWPGMAPSCLGFLPDGIAGTYSATITATNGLADTVKTFTLILEPDTSIMGATPDSLSFTTDGTFVPEEIVGLTTRGDVMPYALVTTASWLSATPESGFMPGNITISADGEGLAPGTYTGTVIVNSAGTEGPPATVLVTLTVEGMLTPGQLGISPSMLSFAYNVNDGVLPPAQTLWVMSGGVPLTYTVSTEDAKWLSVPASGSSPGGLRVSVDPKVGVGMHIANLTFEAPGNDPLLVPVTLVKTAGSSDLVQVMIDVGGSPEGIGLNLTNHNVFITSSNAVAEAGGESEGGPEIEPPGPPEPSIVLQIDPLNQLLVGEAIVHSEGEYIGVNSTTGMAYHASQGAGEVAVINGYNNQVEAFVPLIEVEGVFQPYQIAIDEGQNLIYVGAKSPEPEPTGLIPDENGKYGCKAIQELPSDEGGEPELDCWHAGRVFVIDGYTNTIVGSFLAGDDPEGVVFAEATGKVYASNEDDGNVTVALGAVRTAEGIEPPVVLSTIIDGEPVPGWWEPTCDGNNYCGTREDLKIWLWPEMSACHYIDDEAEEADKMAVDPAGNVYIIDDRYRVAKIDGSTDTVVQVIDIPGYDCEATVPDDSNIVFPNTANNIAYMASGQGKLYVTSEQDTVTLIEWKKKGKEMITKLTTLIIPGAVELDAITTDPTNNHVYITDEALAALWILKGSCANGTGVHCVLNGFTETEIYQPVIDLPITVMPQPSKDLPITEIPQPAIELPKNDH